MNFVTFEDVMKIIPYKLAKRINKTGEGRSGLEIYKRRNRRSYRVIMQYITWKKAIDEGNYDYLNSFLEGYAILITPKEYFGDNYPNPSKYLDKEFKLGENGFIYYGSVSELQSYPPLKEWHEVLELKTSVTNPNEKSWTGEVAFNVKNGKVKVSTICKNSKSKTKKEKKQIKQYIQAKFGNTYTVIPDQSGLGNYDYDYANDMMIKDVKKQMLFMALSTMTRDGKNFGEYINEHFIDDNIKTNKPQDNKIIRMIEDGTYIDNFNRAYDCLKTICSNANLIDFERLKQLQVWNEKIHTPICPLCNRQIYCEDFFKEILQQEGRRVLDNTQREIVLMHVFALKPGTLNHTIYNLGWGHNFCNTIQGDKDIEETIEMLERLVINYRKHNMKG